MPLILLFSSTFHRFCQGCHSTSSRTDFASSSVILAKKEMIRKFTKMNRNCELRRSNQFPHHRDQLKFRRGNRLALPSLFFSPSLHFQMMTSCNGIKFPFWGRSRILRRFRFGRKWQGHVRSSFSFPFSLLHRRNSFLLTSEK